MHSGYGKIDLYRRITACARPSTALSASLGFGADSANQPEAINTLNRDTMTKHGPQSATVLGTAQKHGGCTMDAATVVCTMGLGDACQQVPACGAGDPTRGAGGVAAAQPVTCDLCLGHLCSGCKCGQCQDGPVQEQLQGVQMAQCLLGSGRSMSVAGTMQAPRGLADLGAAAPAVQLPQLTGERSEVPCCWNWGPVESRFS